jgi:hypothetical protein
MKSSKRKPPPVARAAAVHETRKDDAGNSASISTPLTLEQAPRLFWPSHHLCARAQAAWQRLDIGDPRKVVH